MAQMGLRMEGLSSGAGGLVPIRILLGLEVYNEDLVCALKSTNVVDGQNPA